MEDTGARLTPSPLPEALSVENIPEARRPLPEDWRTIQGGIPQVVPVGPGLYNVIHNYINSEDPSGTGVVVPTSVSTLERWKNKTISIIVNGRRISFPIALLWSYHGKPCEKRSKGNYDRVPVSKSLV
jgi:hypothetical protein